MLDARAVRAARALASGVVAPPNNCFSLDLSARVSLVLIKMPVGWRRYYQLFSWEEAPLHDIVYPLSTGIIYTLIVLLWATCREKPFPAGSAEAKHVEMELKQTDQALKPFVGAPV